MENAKTENPYGTSPNPTVAVQRVPRSVASPSPSPSRHRPHSRRHSSVEFENTTPLPLSSGAAAPSSLRRRPPLPLLRASPPATAALVAPSCAAPSHPVGLNRASPASRPTKWAPRAATSPLSYQSAAAAAACSRGRPTSCASQRLVVGGVGVRAGGGGKQTRGEAHQRPCWGRG